MASSCFSLMGQGALLCVVAFIAGACRGVVGPTIPDLACLQKVHLGSLTYILLVIGLSSVGGNLAIPFLHKIFSLYQLLAGIAFCAAVFFFSLPFVGNIYASYLVSVFGGLATIPCYNLVFMKMSELWPGNPRAYYFGSGSVAFGSVVSPLVLSLFVSSGIVTVSVKHNETEPLFTSFNYSNGSSNYTNSDSEGKCDNFLSLVGVPFVMFGIAAIPIGLIFLYFHHLEKSSEKSSDKLSKNNIEKTVEKGDGYEVLEGENKEYTGRTPLEYVMLFTFFLYFFDGQTHTSFSALLPSYGIHKFHISTATMSIMTALFWFFFMIGRVSPGFFPSFIKQFWIICAYCTGLGVGCVLLVFSLQHSIFLWIASAVLGLFYGPRMAANLHWTRTLIPDTPYLISLKFIGLAIGSSFGYLVGVTMSSISTNYFVYMHIASFVFHLFVFLVVVILAKLQNKTVCS